MVAARDPRRRRRRHHAADPRRQQHVGAVANVAVGAAPPPPQPGDLLANDTFTRVVNGGWGAATLGGTWGLTTSAAGSVDGNVGRLTNTAGQTVEARLPVNRADVDLNGRVAFDRLPGAGNTFAYVLARQNDNTAFRAMVRIAPNGAVFVQLKRAVNNAESNLTADTATGLTCAANQRLGFRLRVVGTQLQFRVWDAAGAEPATWNLTATDATAALQAAGGIGLRTYTGSGVPNGPVTTSLDNFELRIP